MHLNQNMLTSLLPGPDGVRGCAYGDGEVRIESLRVGEGDLEEKCQEKQKVRDLVAHTSLSFRVENDFP